MSFPLNPEQREAADFREGVAVVHAGPGSGKTRTIVERVNRLLEEGYPQENIVALTFTREAAEEMAKRANLSEDQKIFRTFHSLCLEIIHAEREKLPFTLHQAPPEPGQQRKLLGSLCRANRVDYKKLTSFISGMKRKGLTPDEALEQALGAEGLHLAVAYRQYEEQCRAEGWIDFDSMLTETVKLLENEEIAQRWQFQFVLVDEAQDTDNVQWKLVELISKENKNVFAVGDEEQLIYAWRGAIPDGLSKLGQKFPGLRTIFLFRNYRSTPEIVAFCKKFAPKKSELIDRMVSERPSGPLPIIRRFISDGDEAAKIISSIVDPEHTAILTRTNRQLSRFENACIDRGIKYNLLRKSGFWTQPEVKYLLAYLQSTQYPTDTAMKTIIQSPFRETKYLKKKDLIDALANASARERNSTGRTVPFVKLMTEPEILNQFQPAQQDNIRRAAQFIRSLQGPFQQQIPATAIQGILDKADIKTYYETEEESDGDNDAIENINELSKIAARYQRIPEFLDFARKAIAASRRSRSPRLTLSTVHQAKGKEWAHVYVAGVCKDVLPHKRGELNEEKRIMWVALTRAADELIISWYGGMSPFLEGHWTPEAEKEFEKQFKAQCIGFGGQGALFE